MQAAVERYRFNRVIPPVNVTTSSMAQQQAAQQAASHEWRDQSDDDARGARRRGQVTGRVAALDHASASKMR